MLLTSIRDFELANPLYVGATVTFYSVDANFHITAIKATLYENPQGTGLPLGNPQILDQFGKLAQPVYIAAPVIAVVVGLHVPTMTTGVIYTAPVFRVDQATSKLQYSYDGGVNYTDTGGWIFRNRGAWANATQYNLLDLVTSGGSVYICVTAHLSVGAFDVSKFLLLFALDQGTLPGGTAFQLRRGSTLLIDAMTPAAGEALEDTTKRTIVVGDGALAGGYPLVAEMAFQGNTLISAVATGTGDAIAATIQSKLVALNNFMRVSILAPGVNALSAPSLNLTLQTAGGANTVTGIKPIVKGNNQSLIAGDIGGTNHVLDLEYYNGNWHLMNPAGVPPAALDPSFLTSLIFPSRDGQWRDVYRAGWLPWGFQQLWGGAQVGNELVNSTDGAQYKFDAASAYIEDGNATTLVGDAAARTYIAQGFKVSESQNIGAIWLKVFKVGNPANNLTVRLLPDDGTGTKPTLNVPIANGTATAQSGKLHTSKIDGEWARFVFPVAPALVAGTVYHIVISSSGAVDASNYWTLKANGAKHYPHGNYAAGDAVPAWTATTTVAILFMTENATANAFMQSSGIFDQKIVFNEGTPIDQSKALVKPHREFMDGRSFTCLIRGTAWTKDKTIADLMYGYDHDRIVLRSNSATGFGQIDLYTSAGAHTVITATAVDLSAGNHDIGIACRMVGDGADYIKLYIDGSIAAQATGQTFTMDGNFRDLGTMTIGGGFNLPVAFTNTYDMTVLPSAAATPATWTGVATEANAMSVQTGKLYQNRGGYTALQDGYYAKAAAGFSNANGWLVAWKGRVSNANNTIDIFNSVVQIGDGTKTFSVLLQEYFVEVWSSAGITKIHLDNRSVENVFLLIGKGSDVYLLCNGRMIFDGTGLLTSATGNNTILFGDLSTTSGENADVVWDYLKYYTTAAVLPQFSTGASLSELAVWSGDKTSLLPSLYNGGAPISAKQYCGVERNYIGDPNERVDIRTGISLAPTYAGATYALVPDMELFVIGDTIDVTASQNVNNATTGNISFHMNTLDGLVFPSQGNAEANNTLFHSCPINTGYQPICPKNLFKTTVGLHKIESRWVSFNGTTLTNRTVVRHMEARSK